MVSVVRNNVSILVSYCFGMKSFIHGVLKDNYGVFDHHQCKTACLGYYKKVNFAIDRWNEFKQRRRFYISVGLLHLTQVQLKHCDSAPFSLWEQKDVFFFF